jgi:hypothetical protein
MPKNQIGSEALKSLQMILLKGNRVSHDENVIFNCFIERLSATLLFDKKVIPKDVMDSNIDRSHGFLIASVSGLKGRRPS